MLNANRTYFLTRSQPTVSHLDDHAQRSTRADETAGHADAQWISLRAYQYSERDYALWTYDPKLAGNTNLARYFDTGEGPVPDIADHPQYYADVADWLVRHPRTETNYIAPIAQRGSGPELRVPSCHTKPCPNSHAVRFTADYYKGDRAMRESGFDTIIPLRSVRRVDAPLCSRMPEQSALQGGDRFS